MIPEINAQTTIDKGFPLTDLFLLEHLTTGAYSPIFGQWLPMYTAVLDMAKPNNLFTPGAIPLWQIARNLQIGASTVLNNLFNQFGSNLMIRAGFLNQIPFNTSINELGHLTGLSFDVSVQGFQDNLYSIAGDIQSIAAHASSMSLMYGQSSWMHMEIDPNKALSTSKPQLPTINSIDALTGLTIAGIQAFRGY